MSSKKPTILRMICSGGQDGADAGGLGGAYMLGIATGGTAPKDYRTESGSKHMLLKMKYGLKESKFWQYPPRTEDNARDSDGTLWVGNVGSPGYKCTLKFVKKYNKPWIENPTPDELTDWVAAHNIEVLNVAGNRESTNPGVHDRTRDLILTAFGDK